MLCRRMCNSKLCPFFLTAVIAYFRLRLICAPDLTSISTRAAVVVLTFEKAKCTLLFSGKLDRFWEDACISTADIFCYKHSKIGRASTNRGAYP